jgi:hypothetical protein
VLNVGGKVLEARLLQMFAKTDVLFTLGIAQQIHRRREIVEYSTPETDLVSHGVICLPWFLGASVACSAVDRLQITETARLMSCFQLGNVLPKIKTSFNP